MMLVDTFLRVGRTEGWMRAIIYCSNNLPNFTYPGIYDETKDHDITSPIFYWRELFHVLFGALIGLVTFFIPYYIPVIIMFLGMGYKEFKLDAREQPNGWDFKNVVDTLAWTLGTLSTYILCK